MLPCFVTPICLVDKGCGTFRLPGSERSAHVVVSRIQALRKAVAHRPAIRLTIRQRTRD
jgi:hypothetical protein